MTDNKDNPGQEEDVSTKGVPGLNRLLKNDMQQHGGQAMPEGEDEDVAAPTEAIDIQALIASGALDDLGVNSSASAAAEPAASAPVAPAAPVEVAPAPVMATPEPMIMPDGPSMMGDGGGGGGGNAGGGGGAPEGKSNKTLIIGLVVVGLVLFCCCPGAFFGGGVAYYGSVDGMMEGMEGVPSADPDEALGEASEDSESGDSGGGDLASLTADEIKDALEGEGYKIHGEPQVTEVASTKSIAMTGIKGTTAATALLYSYDGLGAEVAMKAWQDGVKDTPGTVIKVNGSTGLMVTVSTDKDEAQRLLDLILGN